MTLRRGAETVTVTIALDAGKKPKWINTISMDGDVLLGIYDLDGDDLKSCLSRKRGDRPGEFSTKAGRDHALCVLRRQKQ